MVPITSSLAMSGRTMKLRWPKASADRRSCCERRGSSTTLSYATARRSWIAVRAEPQSRRENSRPVQAPSNRPLVLDATQTSLSSPSSR